jgi:hypothetical protein
MGHPAILFGLAGPHLDFNGGTLSGTAFLLTRSGPPFLLFFKAHSGRSRCRPHPHVLLKARLWVKSKVKGGANNGAPVS